MTVSAEMCHVDMQLEVLTGLQVFTLGQVVPAAQVIDADIELFRNQVQRVAAAHRVDNRSNPACRTAAPAVFVDNQFLSWPDRLVGVQLVPVADLFYRDPVLARNRPEAVATAHPVGLFAAGTVCSLDSPVQ